MKKNPDTFHVLVVADNPEKIYDVKNLLEHAGYFVECRSSFVKALQYLVINSPDLIIVDKNLEVERGLEYATTVCNDPQFNRVLLHSNQCQEHRAQCKNWIANSYQISQIIQESTSIHQNKER